MVPLHDVVEILALGDGNSGVVIPIVPLNRCGTAATLVNGDLLWESMGANRLAKKAAAAARSRVGVNKNSTVRPALSTARYT